MNEEEALAIRQRHQEAQVDSALKVLAARAESYNVAIKRARRLGMLHESTRADAAASICTTLRVAEQGSVLLIGEDVDRATHVEDACTRISAR